MVIVTGGAGFIGSNIVHELNLHGITDILVIDELTNANKFHNLQGARFVDYMDKTEFRRGRAAKSLGLHKGLHNGLQHGLHKVEAILHQGGSSNTLDADGVAVMDNNFTFSKELLEYAIELDAPFIYASTAAVYGLSEPGHFAPEFENECPLNLYDFSKLTFDNYFRNEVAQERVPITAVGLRYFNVYGPREVQKGQMASMIHQFSRQIKENGKMQLFEGSGGYADGEQRRDFVFVRDISKLNMFFAQLGPYAHESHQSRVKCRSVVNAGSGRSRSFNEVARALMAVHGEVPIEYIPMPEQLRGRYRSYTQADLTSLRQTGCDLQFTPLEEGIRETFQARELVNR